MNNLSRCILPLFATTALVFSVNAATVRQKPTLDPAPKLEQFDVVQDRSLFSATAIAGLEADESNSDPNGETAQVPIRSLDPLVISTTPISSERMNWIDEDMRIMASLLADSAGPTKTTPWASGIPLASLAKESKNRNLFIVGTGALFFVNVNFPLSGRTAEENTVEDTPKDTAWERARQKVYGGNPQGNMFPNAQAYNYFLSQYRRPKAYKPAQVRILTEKIASALSSATNIRALKPTDTVWVVVTGPAVLYRDETSSIQDPTARGLRELVVPHNPGMPFQPFNSNSLALHYSWMQSNPTKETRLTISATKQDIDDLNAGVMTMKEFLGRIEKDTR